MNGFLVTIVFLISFSVSAKTVLFLGDSLTEGYGVPREKSYPQLIEKKLIEDGIKELRLINGSVSGSTTASGLSRLRWFLKSKPDVLVLALGANDGLRGVKVETTKANLSKVIEFAQSKNVNVLLVGLRMPPNYGNSYTAGFENMYQAIAKKYKLNFVPHLLRGVAGIESLNQEDGIHPNEKGHAKMAERVYPYLKKLL